MGAQMVSRSRHEAHLAVLGHTVGTPWHSRAPGGVVHSIFTCCLCRVWTYGHSSIQQLTTWAVLTLPHADRRVHFETVATPIDRCGVALPTAMTSQGYLGSSCTRIDLQGCAPGERGPNTNTTSYPRRLVAIQVPSSRHWRHYWWRKVKLGELANRQEMW